MTERRLVVTVGTSLFSSASWKNEGRLRVLVSGYDEWLEDETYRNDPGLRRTRGWNVAQEIEEKLVENPHLFDDVFDWQPDEPRRYPGELNTLLQLYGRESAAGETVEDFLRRRYAVVDLVCPTSQRDRARLAAEQLLSVFRDRLRHPACRLAEVLRSAHLRDKVEQFAGYLGELAADEVDLLVTGGYKAFALLGGLMTAGRPGWRLLYLHEEQQGELVVADADAQGRWRQHFDTGTTLTMVRPTPVGEGP